MTVERGSRVRHLGWGVSSQALSSVSNFAVGIIVLRTVSLDDFGAFAIAYALYLFLVGAFRAFGAKTFTLVHATSSPSDQRRGQGALAGLAILVGVGFGVVLLGASMLLSGPVASTVRVIAGFIPLLLLQDALRFSFVAVGRSPRATVNEAVWIGAEAIAFGLLLATGVSTSPPLLAAWAGAGAVAGLVGLVQARVVPSLRDGIRFADDHRDVNWLLVGEQTVSQGANQVGLLVLGGLLPLPSIGALRSGQLVFGPLNVVQQAAHLVGLPEATRSARWSREALTEVVDMVLFALGATAALFTCVMLLLPVDVGVAVFGDGWLPATTILVPLGLRNVAGGVTIAMFLGLQALGQTRATLVLGATRGLTSLVGTVCFGAAFGLAGAVWAMVVADAVAASLAVLTFRRAAASHHWPDLPAAPAALVGPAELEQVPS